MTARRRPGPSRRSCCSTTSSRRLPGVVAEGRRVIANVERVANLFVTKTVYAMLLAIAVGVDPLAVPLPSSSSHARSAASRSASRRSSSRSGRAPGATCPASCARVLHFAGRAGLVAATATFVVYAVTREVDGVTRRPGAHRRDDHVGCRRSVGARHPRATVHAARVSFSSRRWRARSSGRWRFPVRGTSSRSNYRRRESRSSSASRSPVPAPRWS